jgi:hypothetical protein
MRLNVFSLIRWSYLSQFYAIESVIPVIFLQKYKFFLQEDLGRGLQGNLGAIAKIVLLYPAIDAGLSQSRLSLRELCRKLM